MTSNPKPNKTQTPTQVPIYQIEIEGHLSSHWSDWFAELTITLTDEGHTLLTGLVIDQAALYGLIRKIRDLGLVLISLNRLDVSVSGGPPSKRS